MKNQSRMSVILVLLGILLTTSGCTKRKVSAEFDSGIELKEEILLSVNTMADAAEQGDFETVTTLQNELTKLKSRYNALNLKKDEKAELALKYRDDISDANTRFSKAYKELKDEYIYDDEDY